MERPKSFPKIIEKASPEEMPLYSDEAMNDLIAVSLKQAEAKIEDYKLSHHEGLHRLLTEQIMEEHESRAGRIKLLFKQKRTGMPF
jgi:hypothetical protein